MTVRSAVSDSRRAFLTSVGGMAAMAALPGPAGGNEPLTRTGGPYMKLSLAAYSYRKYLTDHRRRRETAPPGSMTMEDFVDLCGQLDLEGTEPTSYFIPHPVTPEYLRRLRKRAFLLGLGISGTAIGNTFTHPPGREAEKEIAHVKTWIDHAVDLGAPVIRIFAGDVQKGTTEEQARQWAIEAIQRCCDHAAQRGIILALENHGGIVTTAAQLLSIVKAVKSEWFGVNWDSGNFRSADPYAELAETAPYAVTVQIKTTVHPPAGPVEADLGRVIGILKRGGYRGFVALEYEGEEDPRTAVPAYLGKLRKLIAPPS
jgi:sugar phosphate isomerase/epimerase